MRPAPRGLRRWLLPVLAAAAPVSSEPLSLQAAVHQALASHPELAAARQAWSAARAEVGRRGVPPDPRLELEYEGLPSAFGIGSQTSRDLGVVQRLGSPWGGWHRLQAARARAEAVRWEALEATGQDLAQRVADAYSGVLLDQRLLAHRRRQLELARELADKTRRRHELGDAARLNALRAEVEARRAEAEVAERDDALAASRARLNALLARPLDAALDLAGDLGDGVAVPDEEQLQQQALQRRPDLHGSARRAVAAGHDEWAARADVLPQVELGLFRQRLRQAGSAWRLSLGVEVPFWAATRQRAELALARAEARRLQLETEALRERVRLEVRTAALAARSAARQVALFEDGMLREAEAAHEAARHSYEQGEASYLDLQDARRGLIEVNMAYARALHSRQVAVHTLERAVGGPLNQTDGRQR